MAEESVSEDIKRLDDLKDIVQGNIRESQKSTKRPTGKSAPQSTIKIGDRVWRQNIRSQQRKGGKLEANYLGPFTVVALEGKSVDLEREDGTVLKKVNFDHLKKAKEKLPRNPRKIRTLASPASQAPALAQPEAPDSAVPPSASLASAVPTSIYTQTSVEQCGYYNSQIMHKSYTII